MREILFRGKRVDNGEWVEGWLYKRVIHLNNCHTNVVADAIEIYDGKSCLSIEYHTVVPETVGQYTGLTDKNGKRIFEGDICGFEYTGGNRGISGVAAVIFESGKFGVKWGWHKEFVCLDGFANITIEVIGNIHDNPELVEGGRENG